MLASNVPLAKLSITGEAIRHKYFTHNSRSCAPVRFEATIELKEQMQNSIKRILRFIIIISVYCLSFDCNVKEPLKNNSPHKLMARLLLNREE